MQSFPAAAPGPPAGPLSNPTADRSSHPIGRAPVAGFKPVVRSVARCHRGSDPATGRGVLPTVRSVAVPSYGDASDRNDGGGDT